MFLILRKQWKRDRLKRIYDKDIQRLEKAKEWKEAESLRGEAAHCLGEADEEIQGLKSIRLIERARRLPVPLPDREDKTAWDESWERRSLSSKGQADLLVKIRTEESERLKHSFRWWNVLIPIITGLLGILGTYLAMRRHP
jgi:hypothetical protein